MMSHTVCEQPAAGETPRTASKLQPTLRLPVEIFPAGTDPLSPRAEARWLWIFVIVGLTLRLVRYLLRFPLWEDEALLSVNYLDRGYLGLLQPLDYAQVCPPLFLWAQLTVIKLLGFTEYTLRLIPFVCAMLSVPVFRHVAARLFRGTALVLVVAVFAVGYPMIRYTAEAKPYAPDLLAALVMLGLAIEWLRRPHESRWLWWLAAVAGPAIGFSYPAVFVAGGISLVVGYVLWKEKGDRVPSGCHLPERPGGGHHAHMVVAQMGTGYPLGAFFQGWRPWLAFNLILVLSFAGLMALNHQAVGQANQEQMTDGWSDTFPPVTQPIRLVGWLFSIHTGAMLAYPVGGPHGGSTPAFICLLLGLAALARRRQGLLAFLLLAPLGLNFAAAAAHRFPYGGHPRMGLYLGSVFSMLVGLGIAETVAWAAARVRTPLPGRNRALAAALAALLALAAGSLLRDLAHPYKTATTLRARQFARWFWFDVAHDCELVCLKTDARESFPRIAHNDGWLSLYLCNERIYSPRHARGEPPQLDRVSAEWPLRCALYRSSFEERDNRPLQAWLEGMKAKYVLVAHDQYPMPDENERELRSVDYLDVFKFVPRCP